MGKKKKENNMFVGYARVSTKQQDLALQIDAMLSAGVCENNIFVERLSGNLMRSQRPQLEKCLESLKSGDTLVVWKFDRLGRSLADLVLIVQELNEKGIHFKSLTECIDTSSAIGHFFLNLIGSFAEFERNIIKERTKAGLEAARKRGISGGRKNIFSPAQERVLVAMYKEGATIRELQEHFRVSKTCIYRYLHKHDVVKKTSRDTNK